MRHDLVGRVAAAVQPVRPSNVDAAFEEVPVALLVGDEKFVLAFVDSNVFVGETRPLRQIDVAVI